MSELSTVNELLHDVLVRAGESKDDETDTTYELYDFVLTSMNRAYRFIANARQDWPWLRKTPPGVLTVLPKVTTGTVTATKGSTSLTFSTAPLDSLNSNVSLATYFFKASGDGDTFRIATHTSGSTSATLDLAYTGTTGAGKAYDAFPLEYNLASDVVRVVDPMSMSASYSMSSVYGELRAISPSDMNRSFPTAFVNQGNPDYYCFVGETRVRFNRYPSSIRRLEYNYHYRPDDLVAGGTPVLPLERRVLIADFALALLLDTLSDDRADRWLQLANLNIQNFIAEYEYRTMRQSPNMLRILPRNRSAKLYSVRSDSGLRYGW